MGKILCVCISEKRKVSSVSVQRCQIDEKGMQGDIHYGTEKSSVSLLPYEAVKPYFDGQQEEVRYGRFGENLLVQGMNWEAIVPGVRLCSDDVVLEVERVGAGGPASDAYHGFKVCSPMEPWFVFCKVIHGGELREASEILTCDGDGSQIK